MDLRPVAVVVSEDSVDATKRMLNKRKAGLTAVGRPLRKKVRRGQRLYEPDTSLIQRHDAAHIFRVGAPFLRHLLVDFANDLPSQSHYVSTVQLCGPLVCRHFYDVLRNTVRGQRRRASQVQKQNYLRMCLTLRSVPLLRECRSWIDTQPVCKWVQERLRAHMGSSNAASLLCVDETALSTSELQYYFDLIEQGLAYVDQDAGSVKYLRWRYYAEDVVRTWHKKLIDESTRTVVSDRDHDRKNLGGAAGACFR